MDLERGGFTKLDSVVRLEKWLKSKLCPSVMTWVGGAVLIFNVAFACDVSVTSYAQCQSYYNWKWCRGCDTWIEIFFSEK